MHSDVNSENKRIKANKNFLNIREKDELLKKIIGFISKRYKPYIYGSFLEDGGFRDIDVAFYFEQEVLPSKNGTIDLEIQMEAELQKEFGYVFDVRIINHAPVPFSYNVLKNGRLIYTGDDDLRVDFFTATVKKYIDFLPYRKRYIREVLGLEV